MKEVADACGVSKMTVSRVLKGLHYGVSESTREKVLKAANELGYRRNPMVQSLMTQIRQRRTKMITAEIAAIFQDRKNTLYSKTGLAPSEFAILDAIRSTASKHGFRLETFTYDGSRNSIPRIDRIIRARNIKGVFVESIWDPEVVPNLQWENFYAVTHDYALKKPELDRFAEDFFQDMEVAIDKVRIRGYKRIGFATSSAIEWRIRNQKLAAFLLYQSTVDENLRIPVFDTHEMKKGAMIKWIERYQPEVIIGNEEAYSCLLSENLKIPGDIGFVGLTIWGGQTGVASIQYDFTRLGELVAEFLIARILLNQTGLPNRPQTIMIPGIWIEGSSY
jgi:LacI family transcriptional regulator/LacI family repressor for deo operon, udp, cdd, tsx, nupC, and nupG